jgi:hypothetical protein
LFCFFSVATPPFPKPFEGRNVERTVGDYDYGKVMNYT